MSSILSQVNPYETDNVADVLDRALDMSLDERQLRMNQLKRREKRMDVDAWVRGFLDGMDALLKNSGLMSSKKVTTTGRIQCSPLSYRRSE